jgi:hypothetical protein
MSNKQFLLFIGLTFAAFFVWLYYDSKTSMDATVQENVQRDILINSNASGDGAQIKYLFNFPNPVYDHSHSTPQIEGLSEQSGQKENYHIDGLTDAQFGLKTLYQFNYSKKLFQNTYSLWVEDLRVDFSYTTVNVYVSNQYPEGSCEYQATLDHENRHIQIHRQVYEKYQKILQNAFSASAVIPLINHPVTVQSLEDGKAVISQLISGVTDPVFDQFQKELSQIQGQLDSPESYAELQSQCSHW